MDQFYEPFFCFFYRMLISPQVAQHPLKSLCWGGYLGVPVKSAHGGSQGRTRWGRVELPTAGRLCYRERLVCRLHPCLLFLRCLRDSVQKVLAFLQPLCHFEHLCSGLHTVHAQTRFEQVPDVVQRFQADGIHREFILRQHMRYRATFACGADCIQLTIQERAKYHYWLFGHYHDNKAIDEKHILLWEQIMRVI